MVLGVLNVADQFAAGFSGAQTFAANQARTDQMRQNQQVTQLKLDAESNRTLSDQMNNKGYFNFEASNPDQILNVNTLKLLENDKELALEVFNKIPALNTATLENGVKVGVRAVDYFKNDDGSVSFIMQREDNGKRVPLTQGRTERGDDVIAKFSPEDLDRATGTAMVDVLSNGGFASQFGFMKTQAALYPHELRADAERQANELAANSAEPGAQAMASQLSFLLRTTPTDDIETLEQIAIDFGVDLEAAKKNAAAKAQANQTAGDADTTPDAGGTQPDATTTQTTGPNDLSWLGDASNKDKRLAESLDKERTRIRNSISNKLTPKVREEREARLEEIERELGVLEESTAANPIGRLSRDEQRDLTRARANKKNAERELQEFRDKGLREDSSQIRLREERLAKANGMIETLEAKMKPKAEEEKEETPPALPKLTREQLIPLIQEAAQNPEYVARTRQVLQNAGVTNLTQLREAVKQNRVPTKEANDAIIVAAVFAAGQQGANADAATFVERFRNQVLRSSQTRTLDTAIDDDRAERTLEANIDAAQTTKARLRLDLQKFKRQLRLDGDIPNDVLDDQDKIFDEFNTILADGTDIADSTNLAKTFTRLRTRLMGLKGSPNYEGAKKVLPGLYARYMLEVGRNEGAASIPDWFRDIFRSDSDTGIIGNLAPNLVTNSDRSKIGIRDPDGSDVVYESPVATGRLRQLMGIDIHQEFISQLPIAQF